MSFTIEQTIIIRLSQELLTDPSIDRGIILRNQITGTLENCGNSCFINSGIQLLFNIDQYRYFILNTKIILATTICISSLATKAQTIEYSKRKNNYTVNDTVIAKLDIKGNGFGRCRSFFVKDLLQDLSM